MYPLSAPPAAAHGRLRDATYHWARTAAQRDGSSREKYEALRARGHGHARALRSVADRLLKVACAVLRAGTVFDPACPASQTREGLAPPAAWSLHRSRQS